MVGALAIAAVGTVNHVLRAPSPIATPTPGTNANAPGIPIRDGTVVGTAGFALGDSVAGGQGQAVDGIACSAQEYATVHVHAHLALFVKGKQVAVPANAGIPSNGGRAMCLYWLHTHDATGIVHVESPVANVFTLGHFFDIWGQRLERSRVAGFAGPVRAYVNGALYEGDLRTIPLIAHQEITLEVGSYVSPPRYVFPENE